MGTAKTSESSEPDPRATSSGRSVARWARAQLLRWPYGPWPFVVLAALGPLWWGRPYGDYLFGQDSTRLFQPFSFNVSPLVPYSYLFSSTFPVPDFTPYFYVDATLRFFDDLGSPAWLSERLELVVFAGLAAAGAVFLLRAIDAAHRPPRRSSGALIGLAALAYVYNPFTLSVTFWHVEGWTLFLAVLPWVAALAVRLAHEPKVPWRFVAATTLVGIYLAPGAISSFAVPIAVVIGWGLVALWLTRAPRPFPWRPRLLRTGLWIAVAAGVEAWSFGPFLLIPNIAYTSNNYVTPANIVTTYLQASGTWGPYPVLTLTAFSWLVRTPSAYGWIAWLPLVAAAAFVLPVVVLLGARGLGRSPGALLVYAVGLTLLPFMLGGMPPITAVNERFLALKGPFLVLVGGYYFLAPAYLLVAVVGLQELLWRPEVVPPVAARSAPTARPARRTVWAVALHRPSSWIALLIAVLLVVAAFPFATAGLYQTTGPNADAVAVPESFPTLGHYFGAPSGGADYYALVLPMSAQNGAYVDIGGRQFLDTSNLLATFIPYPILETNNGPGAAALESWLAEGPPPNIDAVLSDLHIHYVIVNPYANTSAPSMNEAPGGAPIDYAAWYGALATSLGPATSVGPFSVFAVPDPIPIGWSTSQLVGIDAANDSGALSLIGAVRTGPPGWTEALGTALWSPNGTLPGWTLHPYPLLGSRTTVTVAPGVTATTVGATGAWSPLPCAAGSCSTNGTTYDWAGSTLTVSGLLERSTARPGDFTANVSPSAGGYCSSSGGSVALSSTAPVTAPAVLVANVTLTAAAPNNWATLALTEGNLSLTLQAYQNGTGGPADVGLSAAYLGTNFAWHNVYLPSPIADGGTWQLALDWNDSTAFGSATAAGVTTPVGLGFGSDGADLADPGVDLAAAPPGAVGLGTANESVSLTGGTFCLPGTTTTALPTASYVVTDGPGAPTSAGWNGSSSVVSGGNVLVRTDGATYTILGYPYDPTWRASASGGGAVSEVGGAPLANVVTLGASAGPQVVTFHFQTSILLGLEASWVEVGGLTVFAVALSLRRGTRPPPPAPRTPSTPDGPSPAPPPDRAP
jgi:hypothetical protein